MLVSTAATSYVGLHLFWRISRQSSPDEYTFGWNIWLMNLTCGGLFGYCSSNCITRRNVPSSKGVSAGPMMTAFHVMTLSLTGEAETPAGGSVCMRLKSRIKRRRAAVDILGYWLGNRTLRGGLRYRAKRGVTRHKKCRIEKSL